MNMEKAIELINKEHPNYKKERVEEVLFAIIEYQSTPGVLALSSFDPEKSPIEESALFLLGNKEMQELCLQSPGTHIPQGKLKNELNQQVSANTRSIF